MALAIETKFKGPTSARGASIIATTANGHRLVHPYDHSGDIDHRVAATKLRDKMGWTGRLVGAHTKGGMVFVFLDWDMDYVCPDGPTCADPKCVAERKRQGYL